MGAVTAMLSVTEKNFSPEGADVTVTAQDPEGKDTGAYAESSVDAVRTSEWDRNGSTWTFSMDAFEKDANYTFAMEYEDLAGNRAAAYGPCFFTVDTEAPTGEIIIKTGDGEGKEYAKVLEEKDLKELEWKRCSTASLILTAPHRARSPLRRRWKSSGGKSTRKR